MAAELEHDVVGGKLTIHVNKGGPILSSRVINGNTVNFDAAGQIVSIVVPNPTATINLAGVPFKVGGTDRDEIVRVVKNHPTFNKVS